MRRIFADTFYWIALTNPRDQSHSHAIALSQNLQPFRLVTTEDVLVEFLNYSGDRGHYSRQTAFRLTRQILADQTVQVLPLDRGDFLDGLEFYERRPDKGYSHTDCTSMVSMRKDRITDVLTNDQHFEQEGFRCLFRTRN